MTKQLPNNNNEKMNKSILRSSVLLRVNNTAMNKLAIRRINILKT